VNLPGIEVSEIARGDVLTAADALAPTRVLDTRVHWLAEAPPVERRASVELLAGTAERRARLVPIGAGRIEPGAPAFARLHVEGPPLALLPGDRFVLRGFARTAQGGTTLGGGVVLDVAPPRRRRSDPRLAADLEALAAGDLEAELRVRIARAGLAGIAREALRRETGLDAALLDARLAKLAAPGEVALAPGGLCLAGAAAAEIERRVERAVRAYAEAEPLRPGLPRAALRGGLPANVREGALELALERLLAAGTLAAAGEALRPGAAPADLPPALRALAERVRAEACAAGLEPPALREWALRLGRPVEAVREILVHLERAGALVRAPGDLWFDRTAVDALRDRVVAHLRAHGALETPAYKALIGTTRRHAVPLMELLDAERVTLRVGNRRVLRGSG
jgi:selenocysteine-specific elongation factor